MRRSSLSPVPYLLVVMLGLASCVDGGQLDPSEDAVSGSGGAPGAGAGGPASGNGSSASGNGSASTGGGGAASGGGGAPGTGATGGAAPGEGGGDAETPVDLGPMVNGVQWADTSGNPIQAHGGGMIKVGPYYYWFGENRNPNGTFYAVSCYRSTDLRHWEFRNHVLTMDSDDDLDPANIERPKVVYNESTGKFVMWMHWENGMHYGEARAAVASSDTVDGDYTYHGSFRPLAGSGVTDHGKPGYMSRDCGLFVDDDKKGYFISASNENYDLNLYELTPDYLKINRLVAVLFAGGHREAPALFKRNGVYFLLTSGATGWSPNQAKYATSRSLDRGWSSMTNVADGTTFHSQSTFVLPVQGSAGTSYLYMGDRWAGAWGGRVNDSTYVWQPISFPSDTTMSMSWNNTLTIDTAAGTITGATHRFKLMNKKSGKFMEVAGGSSADGAAVVQAPDSGGDNQKWSLNYNGSGHFRLTNVRSGKVLDVPDESKNDGIALKQWTDHDGDNQAWLFINVGGGDYQIRNKNSGKLVGVVQGSTDDAAAIEQRGSSGGDEQRWRLVVAN
ncbi:RICIN domain-containing protein [Sorangium sp. So ce513]|uniref:RICIN domain-containing protein n=1 Tax=Sorangium sp. So ce513 TaxID=3133315 RepID=UPI003F5DBCC7